MNAERSCLRVRWLPLPHGLRPGWTLIELLVVVALNAILMGLAISVMMALKHFDKTTTVRRDAFNNVTALANQLRKDLHAGGEYRWNAADSTLYVEDVQGHRVVYRQLADRCDRLMQSVGKERMQGALRTPIQLAWNVEPVEHSSANLVRIVLQVPPEEDAPNLVKLKPAEIIVHVGRDREVLHP